MRWLGLAITCVLGLAGAAAAARADDFPTHPLRLVVPFAPGGATDTLGRLTAQALGDGLGQPVLVENRGGANGAIGNEAVAHAAADGYTLLFGVASTQVLNPLLDRFSYDPLVALTPLGMVGETALLLVVNPAMPVDSVAALTHWLKANPARANYGSFGEGSISHLAGLLFSQLVDVPLTHVPYKGAAPAQVDLMAGEIAMLFSDMSAMPLVRAGKLRALAVTSARRSALMPELPTVAETGLPGFAVAGWYALFVPAKTPPAVQRRLSAELARFVAADATKQRLFDLGYDPPTTPPDGFARRMRAERDQWEKVIAAAGIKLQ